MSLPETSVLAVKVARMLEEEIISGALPPGTRVTEDAVISRVKVSRSPVREAFRILEQDGLVIRGERRGITVPPLSFSDLDEVYEVRVSLEGLVAGAAARNATPQDVATLEERLAQLLEIEESYSSDAFFKANTAFSKALYDTSRNKTLTRIATGLSKQALRYRLVAYSCVSGFRQQSQREAQKVLDAIKAGNVALSAETQSALVRSSWNQVRELMLEVGIEEGTSDLPRLLARSKESVGNAHA